MIAAVRVNEAYQRAEEHLSGLDGDWARHIANVGPCLHASKPAREPFEALVRAVAYQQLHAKAGDAILGRLLDLYPEASFPTPAQLLATEPERQRACGFSRRKIITIRGIAEAAISGVVPTREVAATLLDDELIQSLSSLRGIGRWTVEMFLIYTLERPDILPADDFGMREGYRRLKGLKAALTPGQMREVAEKWRPYRTVATWYLWRSPP